MHLDMTIISVGAEARVGGDGLTCLRLTVSLESLWHFDPTVAVFVNLLQK